MKFLQIFNDYDVPIAEEGDRNYKRGWTNVQCPFCGDTSKHLGFRNTEDYCYCWRCGWHPLVKTLMKLLGTNEDTTKALVKEYGGRIRRVNVAGGEGTLKPKELTLPTGTGSIADSHEQYLLSRGFDPRKLVEDWGLMGTGPISLLDGINFKHRIIAPIHIKEIRSSTGA